MSDGTRAMKVLVLNSGSSSIKYQLFAMPEAQVLASGLVERIGELVPDHGVGLRQIMALLTTGANAPLADISELGAVGHRVVHGGERFAETVAIDDDVIDAIAANAALAPLHNPPNLLGIRVARELLGPSVPQVAVFDTAFHHDMPPHAYRYALPTELYTDAGIRRYGFHGTSHRFVATKAAAMLGKELSAVNLITCHLGNGSSVAAIAGGRSVDTSMGLTPLEGLVMGSRSGDLDPGVVFHLARTRGLSVDAIDKLLNKQSGLLGLSGLSNDVRELLAAAEQGHQGAKLALDVFAYRLKKYLGAYLAVLGGTDAIVFTAGIGENAPVVRAMVCEGLGHLGVAIDPERNASARGATDISAPGAIVRVLVIPTDEERLIAQDTYAVATQP